MRSLWLMRPDRTRAPAVWGTADRPGDDRRDGLNRRVGSNITISGSFWLIFWLIMSQMGHRRTGKEGREGDRDGRELNVAERIRTFSRFFRAGRRWRSGECPLCPLQKNANLGTFRDIWGDRPAGQG